MGKNNLTLLGPGCNINLSTFAQKTVPEWWERVPSAVEEGQKFPVLSIFFKTTKKVLALRAKFPPSLKFLAGAVIGMTRGTSLSLSPPS